MKLFFHKDERGNFGDDLNESLWQHYIPNLEKIDSTKNFVGIGTLLNHKLPKGNKIIFGSGYGYGQVPIVDKAWEFFAVRGPKTAEILKIDKKFSITDPAILLGDFYENKNKKTTKIGFIPHSLSCYYGDWKEVCNSLGIELIDPCLSVEEFLAKLSKCESVICEAMHGAIAADALRIPWKPIAIYPFIFDFKWHDWTNSLNMEYKPTSVSPIWHVQRHYNTKQHLTYQFKKTLKSIGIWSKAFSELPEIKSTQQEVDLTTLQIRSIIENDNTYYLSADNTHHDKINQYKEVFEKFNSKYILK
ncbi:polysaccharide pyruvyl transferase family protein [Colwellia ponticola]|uniref:polysaccharide pyruvyl transferase family protein n=1 Tax=Colwellia ponticola TaxID=2304625 RepID=UPI0014864BC3|nr:polysaccharide pyruvyl transferase family protein [Colwellia ponticola]